jgi:acyl carrier protein
MIKKILNKDEILEIVITKVKSLVETLPEEQKYKVDENTILFGNGSNIDSLSLVSIIVDLETTFSVEYNFDISLTDDRAMLREKSPFESISAMVEYIDELVNEN